MKKVALGLLATMLVVGANTAWADSSTPNQEATKATVKASAVDEQVADDGDGAEDEREDEVVEENEEALAEDVADEEVEELTAEERAAELNQLLDELEQELEEAEYREAVDALTAELEQEEEWELALVAQKKLATKLVRDKEVYQRIGQLYEKAGITGIKTFINGNESTFDIPPVIKDGRTLVPIRGIAESLGAEVAWDAESRTITIVRGGVTVILPVGSTEATVDGQTVKLDVPAEINNGRTVVPLRFVAEALQAEVEWIASGQVIVIIDGTDNQAAASGEQQETEAEETAEQEASENEQATEPEADTSSDSEQPDESSTQQTEGE